MIQRGGSDQVKIDHLLAQAERRSRAAGVSSEFGLVDWPEKQNPRGSAMDDLEPHTDNVAPTMHKFSSTEGSAPFLAGDRFSVPPTSHRHICDSSADGGDDN